MPQTKQLELFRFQQKDPFGGMLLRGKRKEKRPVPLKSALHIALKSKVSEHGRRLSHFKRRIESIIRKHADLNGVLLHEIQSDGEHIHILAQFRSPSRYRTFIRAITGLIARVILGVERGRRKGLSFWAFRPFSRVVQLSRSTKGSKRMQTLKRFCLDKVAFDKGDQKQREVFDLLKSLAPPLLKQRLV